MSSDLIPTDVRARIVSAADSLYEQANREAMPTVDQVRRAAKVDMNAASAVMREWRRQQTAQAAPVVVTIPEALQAAHSQALAALWTQAQDLANDALRGAQSAWETERAELDSMRQEMAAAYESQAIELDAAQERAAELQSALDAAGERHRTEIDAVRAELAALGNRAERAEARVADIERDRDQARADAEAARRQAGDAREAAAKLSGQLEAVQAQNKALMDALPRAKQ